MTLFILRSPFSAYQIVLLIVGLFALSACSTTEVKTSTIKALEVSENVIPENRLLDVGINLFDPGLDSADDDQSLYPEVRQGEARYFPYVLMETMQRSAHWGAVRVVPSELAAVDVHVKAKILSSDGERLELQVEVFDSTGREWFEREYKEVISDFVYKKRRVGDEPFQSIYNRIANDIASYRANINAEDSQNIRTVSELRFAQDFAPEAFARHLSKNDKGLYEVQRLPAELDPMLGRIRKIRDRDYLFVDTLQDYYGVFHRQMDVPYMEWRERSYDHAVAIRELRRSRSVRGIAGAAAVIAGIVAVGGGDIRTRASGGVGIAAGGALITSALKKGEELSQHSADFTEISESVTAAITPQVMELDDQTITLSGTATDQYQQWRELLKEIYRRENGLDAEAAPNSAGSSG